MLTRSGFKKQLETMFKPVRVVATILLFASVAMCFVSAFVLPAILCIVFVIVRAPRNDWIRVIRVDRADVAGSVSRVFMGERDDEGFPSTHS